MIKLNMMDRCETETKFNGRESHLNRRGSSNTLIDVDLNSRSVTARYDPQDESLHEMNTACFEHIRDKNCLIRLSRIEPPEHVTELVEDRVQSQGVSFAQRNGDDGHASDDGVDSNEGPRQGDAHSEMSERWQGNIHMSCSHGQVSNRDLRFRGDDAIIGKEQFLSLVIGSVEH